MKKIIIAFISLFLFPLPSYAIIGTEPVFYCTPDEQNEITALSANVTIDYEINMINDTPLFTITLTNLTDDMILIDRVALKTYQDFKKTGSEVKLTTSNSGTYDFDIYSKKCKSRVSNKSISLPRYNSYYNDPLCSGLSSYKQCQRWSGYNESREVFEADIKKIEEELNAPPRQIEEDTQAEIPWYERLSEIFTKFWWVGIIVIVSITFIIYLIYSKKKEDEYDFKL